MAVCKEGRQRKRFLVSNDGTIIRVKNQVTLLFSPDVTVKPPTGEILVGSLMKSCNLKQIFGLKMLILESQACDS